MEKLLIKIEEDPEKIIGKIDNEKLDLLDDTIESDQDNLYDMEDDLNNMLDRLRNDLKKFKETNLFFIVKHTILLYYHEYLKIKKLKVT